MADAVAQLLPLFPAVPLIAAAFALLAPWRAVRDSIMLIIPGVGIFAGPGPAHLHHEQWGSSSHRWPLPRQCGYSLSLIHI